MTKMDIVQHAFLALESNGMNLTSYLAQLGQFEAVQQLIDHGGAVEDAIYGYALAANTTQIASILEKCPESKKAACIGNAIKGYARAGNAEQVYAIADYRRYKADFLFGLAQAGDKDKVTAILDRDISFCQQAVEGYASCNHDKLLSNLVKGTPFYPTAIYHAARSGHTALVNDLLLQCGITVDCAVVPSLAGAGGGSASAMDIHTYSLINHAAKGYVAGRHFNEAIAMLSRGASITPCLADLKDDSGLPNHELYMAFLAHIKDAKLKDAVLNKIGTQSKAMARLKITAADLGTLEEIMCCMDELKLNYVEALGKVEDASSATAGGDITLHYLAEIMSGMLAKQTSLRL